MYVCTGMCVCVCEGVCECECVSVCVYVCMYVCMYVWGFTAPPTLVCVIWAPEEKPGIGVTP